MSVSPKQGDAIMILTRETLDIDVTVMEQFASKVEALAACAQRYRPQLR